MEEGEELQQLQQLQAAAAAAAAAAEPNVCDRDAKTLDGDPSTGRQWTLLRGFLAGLPELPRVLQDAQPANGQLERIGRPIHRKVNPEKRTTTTDPNNSKNILFLSKSFQFVLVCLKYI